MAILQFPNTIDKKLEIQDENGNNIIEIISKSYNNLDKFRPIGFHTVQDWEECRPDLVSKSLYGSQEFIEILLKTNQISNPFSIESGDILFKYDNVEVMNSGNSAIVEKLKKDTRFQYLKDRQTKMDPKYKQFLERENKLEQLKNAELPPNFAKVGDVEVKIEGGKIIFGDDVNKNNEDCKKPISKSKFLLKIIDKKIN